MRLTAGEMLRIGEEIHRRIESSLCIARRKRGRGLGARKRRMREAKVQRHAQELATSFRLGGFEVSAVIKGVKKGRTVGGRLLPGHHVAQIVSVRERDHAKIANFGRRW